jgi:hypothetical protein
MGLSLMKKRTLFSKIQAVRAHESEQVSWASQLLLQTLAQSRFSKTVLFNGVYYCKSGKMLESKLIYQRINIIQCRL